MIKNFIEKCGMEYYSDCSLKKYNTYRLDLKCKYLVMPQDVEEFVLLLKEIQNLEMKYLVLGNGSNVIFEVDYYDGVVILLNHLNEVVIDDDVVEVGAGYSLQRLAVETVNLGLEGLEFATGIPGLVGASIAMNAGAYKSSLSEVVEKVVVVNPQFEVVTMTKEELVFSYRDSFFKENIGYYIVGATLRLQRGSKEELLEKVSKRRVKRLETQPLDMPSAGSVFRNPEGMHAGELIEKCGLKGYEIHGAVVSEKHANFIVNAGGARGRDIVKLVHKVQDEVQKEFGVELILEQIIVN